MIPGNYYYTVFLIIILVLCVAQSRNLISYTDNNELIDGYQVKPLSLFFFVSFIIFYIGFRPVSECFTDMLGYARRYEIGMFVYDSTDIRKEPVWLYIQKFCYQSGFSTQLWFATVTGLSFLLQYNACKKWFGNHVYTALLFLTTGFYFWSMITGIIRSCLALSFVIYGMSLFTTGKIFKQSLACFLFIIALYTHTSSVLVSSCFLVSYFLVKKIDLCIYFWILCLVLSLLFEGFFENFFSSIGFDDRMSSFDSERDYEGFAHAGFRWDFLLYSLIPILLGKYVANVGNYDKVYSSLLCTYILSNAFWLLVIRAEFSDRFAGLSWSIYPIVIAYPFLKLNIWEKQFLKVSGMLIAHVSFVVGMHFLYYGLLR